MKNPTPGQVPMTTSTDTVTIEFPVARFPEGEVAPPMQPDHPTWALMGPWTDPMAERGAYNNTRRQVVRHDAASSASPAAGTGWD